MNTKNKTSETSTPESILPGEIFSLNLQIFWGRLLLFPVGWFLVFMMKYFMGYKVRNKAEVRKRYKELTKTNQPVLICPNHLTMIDSAILIWACAPVPWYQLHYSKMSWNVPAVENFKSTLTRSILTYLNKCIPVDRNGTKEHFDSVLRKTIYLLKKGEVFTYFPEGGRSRTKRIDMDNIRYGVGKIVAEVPNTKVICIYLRGDHQDDYSDVPQKGETFSIEFQELYPDTKNSGLRAHRDISIQIMQTLYDMEKEYFQKNAPAGK